MADKYVFHNNYGSTLNDILLIGGTTAEVVDAGDLATPATGYRLVLTLIDKSDDTIVEIVSVTAVSGQDLTITRAQEGTTAREWPVGTLIQARVTAAMLDGMAGGLDTTGTVSSTGTDLQRVRDNSGQAASGSRATAVGNKNTASGSWSSAIGYSNTASGNESFAAGLLSQALGTADTAVGRSCLAEDGQGLAAGYLAKKRGISSIAMGYQAETYDLDALPEWAATTAYYGGNMVKVAGVTDYVLVCVGFGTSGATAPTYPATADGTVTWYWVPYTSVYGMLALGYVSKAVGAGAQAVGPTAVAAGDQSLAFGATAQAIGDKTTAVGGLAIAAGERATAIGSLAKAGPGETVLGDCGLPVGVRDSQGAVAINSKRYRPFKSARNIGGLDFVDQHDWWHTGSADADETLIQATGEMTFYSIPIQLGDAGWPGAAQAVKHGQSIREGSYIYTAYIWGGDYFEDGVTGGTEPTWPTTPGDDVSDGDVSWICVDPASIEFLLPDYARFTPTQVGVIAKWSTPGGSVVYPQLTFGVTGDLDSWLAATTFSKVTGDNSSHFVDPTATVGAKQFGAALTTPGTDLDCTAVIVIKGYVIESQDA